MGVALPRNLEYLVLAQVALERVRRADVVRFVRLQVFVRKRGESSGNFNLAFKFIIEIEPTVYSPSVTIDYRCQDRKEVGELRGDIDV
jgi:hypothetical protein